MNLFGFTLARTKALNLAPVDNSGARGGWWRVLESYSGAWQNNVEVSLQTVTTHATVFACTTLISSDVAKMRIRFVEQDGNGIWNETQSSAFSPVLKKPNPIQNRIGFYSTWILSKLFHGNTYVLKQYDDRRVCVGMYVLDPNRVRPLVAPDGSVYYELKRDDLSRLPQEQYTVPASMIIHDLHNAIFHPLVGLSAIYACGLAATQGLNIQNNSTRFFANGSNPGGVLTAPGAISQPTADRLKAYWDSAFNGEHTGKVAVLGDGLKYERMAITAVDSQLIEQLRWTSENVCSAFHVPPHLVGVGPAPAYNNIEALSQQYYSQCLQVLIEAIELCLDEGLGLTTGENATKRYGTEFDLDDLLRMDSATMMTTIQAGVGAGVMKPNEGRKKLNYAPVEGGDTPYLQVQNYSLSALNKRDSGDPFAPVSPPVQPVAAPADAEDDDEDELDEDAAEKHLTDLFRREFSLTRAA